VQRLGGGGDRAVGRQLLEDPESAHIEHKAQLMHGRRKIPWFFGLPRVTVEAVSSSRVSLRFLALAGTAVLWASAFPAIRVAVDGLGVAALSFLRLASAAVALALVAPFAGARPA
jgi:hypothetical protein